MSPHQLFMSLLSTYNGDCIDGSKILKSESIGKVEVAILNKLCYNNDALVFESNSRNLQ
jgi:hypothetical protein